MIGYLTGLILEKKPPHLLLDVQGVGYELQVPMPAFYQLPEQGQSVSLHTHLSVREDAWHLFGFLNQRDRELFRILIKVNGIGAKAALSLLSGMEPPQLLRAIAQSNVKELVQIPGIGKKTAERLILETKGPLSEWECGQNDTQQLEHVDSQSDAVDALTALGYKAAEAKKTLASLPTDLTSTEEMIRHALKKMVKGGAHV